MALLSFSVHHLDHGMAAVERVAPAADGLASRLRSQAGIRGALVLSTCNRLEVYVDADVPLGRAEAIVRGQLRAAIEDGTTPPNAIPLRARGSQASIRHLFEVAAGLDSMVLGEREIAGQLRRSLKASRLEKTSSPTLHRTVERALRCSRQVETHTALSGHGRSVVSVGLDMAMHSLNTSAPQARVVLVGTGSYAGAAVHALRTRRLNYIEVYSRTGRGEAFAASHALKATTDLADALKHADLVVCCSGTGGFVLTPEIMANTGPMTVLDLALQRDVDPAVGDLTGITLLTLTDIQQEAGPLTDDQVAAAKELIDERVDELLTELQGRQMDPAVIALRDLVAGMVEDEIARLPADGDNEAAAHALRRLAARLIHSPIVRARKAAEQGRQDDFVSALGEIYDLDVTLKPLRIEKEMVDPGTLDCGTCPATGYDLNDLKAKRDPKAAM